ncbi:hypothetical protein PAAG_08521 [Paracoccidioides lutzii Pb01]|uniref:Uncharacterized protein n=1 Tax=Paracoccidioides lutzii (strain ATCC MYA-826 / Pb01) TaxID=502779 RepID=C1HCN0_PARBA|nr:hypothetical protein PAAG_08521 [Paracoccidioides lutzii Pb01]EEH38794.2 hypothetical protein PAAG_08521 [Paracoccidioides lutzii Pb01]
MLGLACQFCKSRKIDRQLWESASSWDDPWGVDLGSSWAKNKPTEWRLTGSRWSDGRRGWKSGPRFQNQMPIFGQPVNVPRGGFGTEQSQVSHPVLNRQAVVEFRTKVPTLFVPHPKRPILPPQNNAILFPSSFFPASVDSFSTDYLLQPGPDARFLLIPST